MKDSPVKFRNLVSGEMKDMWCAIVGLPHSKNLLDTGKERGNATAKTGIRVKEILKIVHVLMEVADTSSF